MTSSQSVPFAGARGFAERPLEGPVGIVVLGASVRYEFLSGRMELVGATARRASAARNLYVALRDNGGAVVIAAGGRTWNGVAEATALRDALVAHGVPRERVVRELCSLSTGENARFAISLIGTLGIRRVVVVTCEWHVPRAVAAFRREAERLGIDVVGHAVSAPPATAPVRLMRWVHERAATAAEVARHRVFGTPDEMMSV